MKKIAILILVLWSCQICTGQIREIGLKTGITNSLININSIDNNGNKTSYNTSNGQSFYTHLYTQFYNYQNFSLQGGLGIIEKNSDYQYKIRVGNINDSVTFNTLVETRAFFIETNAKLKLLIPELPNIVPYLLFGPQISFLNKQSNTIPFKLADTQLQGNFGIGTDIDFKKIHAFAEYNCLMNFNTNYSENANYEFTEKTGIFMIGLKFLIKPKNLK